MRIKTVNIFHTYLKIKYMRKQQVKSVLKHVIFQNNEKICDASTDRSAFFHALKACRHPALALLLCIQKFDYQLIDINSRQALRRPGVASAVNEDMPNLAAGP